MSASHISSPEKINKKENKKENILTKFKPRRKKTAREKIYLGKFEDDLSFLEDFVDFQKLCQQQTKTQYTVLQTKLNEQNLYHYYVTLFFRFR